MEEMRWYDDAGFVCTGYSKMAMGRVGEMGLGLGRGRGRGREARRCPDLGGEGKWCEP